MNIEVGKQYRYVTPKGMCPHPNEIIEDDTIVTVAETLLFGVMLKGYQYPHKKERLQELPKAKQSVLEHTMKRLVQEGHSVEDISEAVQSLVDEAKAAKPVTTDEMFED